MNSFLPIVLIKGTEAHPRYALGNTRGEVWTGSDWTEDHGKALLYGEFGSIGNDTQRLLIMSHDWDRVVSFTVPLTLEVYGTSPVDREHLMKWLERAFSFFLNYGKFGTGPDGALVLSLIDWSKLRRDEDGPAK